MDPTVEHPRSIEKITEEAEAASRSHQGFSQLILAFAALTVAILVILAGFGMPEAQRPFTPEQIVYGLAGVQVAAMLALWAIQAQLAKRLARLRDEAGRLAREGGTDR